MKYVTKLVVVSLLVRMTLARKILPVYNYAGGLPLVLYFFLPWSAVNTYSLPGAGLFNFRGDGNHSDSVLDADSTDNGDLLVNPTAGKTPMTKEWASKFFQPFYESSQPLPLTLSGEILHLHFVFSLHQFTLSS